MVHVACDLGHDFDGCSSGGCGGQVSSGRVDIGDHGVSVKVCGHGLRWCWYYRVGFGAVKRGRQEEENEDKARYKRKNQMKSAVNM